MGGDNISLNPTPGSATDIVPRHSDSDLGQAKLDRGEIMDNACVMCDVNRR